jgi:Ras-related protein Rab-8A
MDSTATGSRRKP